MGKSKKTKVLILLITGIVIIAGIYFFRFHKRTQRNVWDFVPHDAAYIIETDNLSKGWNTIAGSDIWNQLITDPLFEGIQENALSLDSLIRLDKAMNRILSDKASLVSCHVINNNSYDFLFAIDIKKAGKFAFLKSHIKGLVGYYGYDMKIDKFKNFDILKFTEKATGDAIYISVIDNILIASYNKGLIQKSVIASRQPCFWEGNTDFRKITAKTSGSSLFHLYVSHNYLPGLISYYVTGQDKLLAELKKIFNYSAFDFDFKDNRIIFDGTTLLKDSVGSYLHTLSGITPGAMEACRVIPNDMAMYLSITFDNYMKFYDQLIDKYSSTDTAYAESYLKTVNKVEKMLKINLKEDFFSWIGNEIALVKLPPRSNTREYDVIACINVNNIDNAKKGLDKIYGNIDKKTPIKTRESEYKGIPIHYFALNGFFKMFFGKLFAKLEKPYFIYLDDFVVFSNNRSALSEVIDAWLKRKTLQNDNDFIEFADNFEKKSNVTIFLKGPKIYNHLYHYAQKDIKNDIKNNKELIASFQYTGFQLISEAKGLFTNRLVVRHNMDALYEEKLEQIENEAEELYVDGFDSLLALGYPEDAENGKNCRIFGINDTSRLVAEGRIKRGKPDDVWRFYYDKTGNIKGIVTFDKGIPDGKALLFYDTHDANTMARTEYDGGVKKGQYEEYYKNGKIKCVLEFKNNKPNGDATFFYDSGQKKIEGHYKKGMRNGKWKHYTENGELYDKEKWKKDRKK